MLLCLGRKVVRLEGRRVNRQIVWYYDTTVCQVLDHWVCQITLQLTLSTLSALKLLESVVRNSIMSPTTEQLYSIIYALILFTYCSTHGDDNGTRP